jgi:hypothetical protein
MIEMKLEMHEGSFFIEIKHKKKTQREEQNCQINFFLLPLKHSGSSHKESIFQRRKKVH